MTVTYDTSQGGWVSEDIERTASVLQDWDPLLTLQWIPDIARTSQDTQPYRIVHTPLGKPQYVVVHLSEEEAKNTDLVLATLFAMRDNTKDPEAVIARLDEARAIREAREEEERRGPVFDLAHTMWKSPLHTFRHKGKKIDL